MTVPSIRAMTAADVDAVADLMSERRARYEIHSPVFWRPAANAVESHKPFLDFLVADPATTSLVAIGDGGRLAGVLIAMPRGEGILIDDFAVPNDADWDTTGRALLRRLADRLGTASVTAVTAVRDESRVELLLDEGFDLQSEWWILPVADAADPAAGDQANVARPIDAPPVYDPGGKVAMTERWDGTAAGLDELRHQAAGHSVLLIVPIAAAEEARRSVASEAGGHPASAWFHRTYG